MTKQITVKGNLAKFATTLDGRQVWIDADALIDGRLLDTASTGGGKSYNIRVIIERTHTLCQQILIDKEGEYPTLRELKDNNFVLAGIGETADIQIGVKQPDNKVVLYKGIAEALVRHVVFELEASLIIDIFELSGDQQYDFVTAFVNAFDAIPKERWGINRLLVLDEGHKFAAQEIRKGEARAYNSLQAVKSVAEHGRKRGESLLLATQRLAKMNKDVAAECENKIVGRTNDSDDRKRAAEELGNKKLADSLRTLQKGHCYVVGSAFKFDDGSIVTDAIEVIVDEAVTTHLGRGKRVAKYIPPKSASVAKMLEQLTGLQKVAEEDLTTKDGMLAKIKQQAAEIEKYKRQAPAPKVIEKPVVTNASPAQLQAAEKVGYDRGFIAGEERGATRASVVWESHFGKMKDLAVGFAGVLETVQLKANELATAAGIVSRKSGEIHSLPAMREVQDGRLKAAIEKIATDAKANSAIEKIVSKLQGKGGITMISTPAGKEGFFAKVAADKQVTGLDTKSGAMVKITSNDSGIVVDEFKNSYEGMPEITPTMKAMLGFCFAHPGQQFSLQQIAVKAGFSTKSSGVSKGLGRLVKLGYLDKAGSKYSANENDRVLVQALLGEDFDKGTPKSLDEWIASGKLATNEAKILKALATIKESPLGATLEELAAMTSISVTSSGLSKGITGLVAQGFVERLGGKGEPQHVRLTEEWRA